MTQFAGAARILWRLLESKGIDPVPIYAQAGIDAAVLHGQRARIGVDQMDQVWTQVTALLGDDCIALEMPEFWRPGDFQALDHAWLASTTLEGALSILVRYLEVVDQSGRLRLVRSPRGTALCGMQPRLGLKDHAIFRQGVIAVFVHMARLIAGPDLVPLEVTFRGPAPSCASRYAPWFGCPVQFSAPSDCVLFDQRDLTRPLSAQADVGVVIERILFKEVARLRAQEGIAGRVQALLADAMPSGKLGLGDIAAFLSISPFELKRRLRRAGTSYRAELDAVRRAFASQYLSDSSLSLIEIAFLLGFSEQSAFSRACRRWFDAAPSELRKR